MKRKYVLGIGCIILVAAIWTAATVVKEAHLRFFMADMSGDIFEEEEMFTYDDMILVGGPDSDPPVKRDATYVLDRPSAHTYRIAYGGYCVR